MQVIYFYLKLCSVRIDLLQKLDLVFFFYVCILIYDYVVLGIASVVAGVTPDRFKSVTLVEGLGNNLTFDRNFIS